MRRFAPSRYVERPMTQDSARPRLHVDEERALDAFFLRMTSLQVAAESGDVLAVTDGVAVMHMA